MLIYVGLKALARVDLVVLAELPFTTYHLASGLLVGWLLRKRLHWPTLLIATTLLVDAGLVLVILSFRSAYFLHVFAHTLLGCVAFGLLSGLAARLVFKRLNWLEKLFEGLYLAGCEECGLRDYVLAGVLGWLVHVVLDVLTHASMHPLAPFANGNPLLVQDRVVAELAYNAILVAGLAVYLKHFYASSFRVSGSLIARFQVGALMALAGLILFPLGLRIEGYRNDFAWALSQVLVLLGLLTSLEALRKLGLIGLARSALVAALATAAVALYFVFDFNAILASWATAMASLVLLRKPLAHVKLKVFSNTSVRLVDALITGWALAIVLVGVPVVLLALLMLVLNANQLRPAPSPPMA
ncbi:MAG: hypothetical protein ACP5KA_03715 [Desulfurococcaceae archaeon]